MSALTADAVTTFLASLRQADNAPRTINKYLIAVKGFSRWAWRTGKLSNDPLASLSRQNEKADQRTQRRALSPDELRNLINTTEQAPHRFGMTGPERAMLYRLAVETGLRAGELRSLTRASFNLDTDTPTVTLEAAYSKRRRKDTLPLRESTADALRAFLATKAPAAIAFNMPTVDRTADMIKADLKDAAIEYKDASGKVADFHALRHTFVTNLATGGVHPKTAQALARHSSITLTLDRYTHSHAGDELAALDILHDLDAPTAQQAKATGTDGKVENHTPRNRTSNGSAKQRISGASRCDEDRLSICLSDSKNDQKSAGKREYMRADATQRVNGSSRIRTRDQGIMSPQL